MVVVDGVLLAFEVDGDGEEGDEGVIDGGGEALEPECELAGWEERGGVGGVGTVDADELC